MKKILVVLIGILLTLLLLEAGLQLVGIIYHIHDRFAVKSLSHSQSNPYQILCLGNSYTKGIGATLEMSYPAQLQRMFNEHISDKNIVVINGGEGGQNTTQLLRDLRSNIKKYDPQLIILQIGQCNSWNFSYYSDYLIKINKKNSFLDFSRYLLTEFLFKSRIYKLVTLVSNEWRRVDPLVDPAYRKDKEYVDAMAFLKAINANYEPAVPANIFKYEKALGIFKNAVKLDPKQVRNYLLIGFLYFNYNNTSAALKWYFKAYRVALAQHDSRGVSKACLRIKEMLIGDDKGTALMNKKIYEVTKNMQQPCYLVSGLSRSTTTEWVESDLREIIEVVKKNKVKLILQNYPKWVFENSILAKIADEYKLPFVDNYSSFEEKLRHGFKKEDLFVPDSHCTARGYGLMAGNVFNKIEAEGFLNGSSQK